MQCGFCTPGLIVAAHDLLNRIAEPTDLQIREALAGNLCRCTGYEKILDAVRLAARDLAAAQHSGQSAERAERPERGTRMTALILEGCAIVTMDGQGTEHATGYVVVEGNRITAVGPGSLPAPVASPHADADISRVDGRGCLATPAWSILTIICTSGAPGGWQPTRRCSAG